MELNESEEEPLFESEYQAALYATSGKAHFESYGKGKKNCPTDVIEHPAADEKSSGQGIIFGTKPLPILIPYIKVLTQRGGLVVEPFGGSGSTLIASNTVGRRCFLMGAEDRIKMIAFIALPHFFRLFNTQWRQLHVVMAGRKMRLVVVGRSVRFKNYLN